ncbi:hypothetical protein [Blastococcus sp. PRF04-17]|uniref:hypothetical protein n=1 Tax=Blastococcus sp. PRF04-17 TaxID=2933797 RepID=UPI003F8D87BD
MPAPADYGLAVTARPRPGAALDRLIASAAGGVRARSNGSVVPDPRAGPWAAVDGDPATAWLAAPGPGERLRVSWPTEQRITQIRVHYTAGTAAARPLVLTLRAGGAERLVTLDRRGIATFPALVTDSLSIDFLTRVELTSLDTYTGERSELGVGVSELEIPGVPSLSVDARVDLACGEGPDVVVDGVRYPTSAQATVRELLDLRPLELTICPPAAAAAPGGAPAPGTLSLDAGEHSLVAASTAALGVESATLRRVGTALPVTAERRAVDAGRWEAENRVLEIDRRDQPTLLVVPENVNDGWRATLDGDPLRAVQVDGWQQGYLVPPGAAGVVELTFEPGSAYRTALLAGAAAAALLVVLARVPARHRAPTPSRRPGRGVPSVLVAAAAGGLLLAIGGLWSLLAVAVVAAVFGRARRYRALALVSTACVLAAGALLAAGDAVEPVRQLLVLTALAGVVLSVCAPASSAGPARRAGSGA